MIYLIKTSSMVIRDMNDPSKDEVAFVYKIGYSNDRRKLSRFTDYRSQGHIIRVLKYIPGGSTLLEQALQEKFRKYSIPGRSKEWFYENSEILDCFNSCNDEKDLYGLFGCKNDEGLVKPKKLKKQKKKEQSDVLHARRQYQSISLEIFEKYKEGKSEEDLLNDSKYPILIQFNVLTTFKDKMGYLCTLEPPVVLNLSGAIPEEFLNYYRVLGPERIYSLGSEKNKLDKEYLWTINSQVVDSDLLGDIYNTFKIGNRYTKSDIKDKLRDIYKRRGVKKSAKATDLDTYFDTRFIKISIAKGNRKPGLEILGRK